METLEELKEKFNKLDKERGILFKRILELEDQETLKKFTVGNCYIDIYKNYFAKIIAIDNDELCAIIVDESSIKKDWFTAEDIKIWEKITSRQFRDVYHAVIKDITDPDFENNEESNFDIALKSIYDNINKEK